MLPIVVDHHHSVYSEQTSIGRVGIKAIRAGAINLKVGIVGNSKLTRSLIDVVEVNIIYVAGRFWCLIKIKRRQARKTSGKLIVIKSQSIKCILSLRYCC